MTTPIPTQPSPERPGALNWVLVMLLGVIWGSAFMGQAVALEGFGPLTVAALRCALGGLALIPLAQFMGQGLRQSLRAAQPGKGRAVLAIGLIGTALPFTLLAWGLQHVPSAFAGVAMGSVPILLLPLVAIFSPEEGIGPRRIMGVVLGLVGLTVLIGPGAWSGAGPLTLWGQLACLGAATCYAIGSVVTRRAPAMPPVAFAAATLCVAGLLLVPLALLLEGVPTSFPLLPSLALLLTAIFPTGLAAALRIRVIRTAGSLFMSLVSYMVPVWSVLFGIVLLQEELPPGLFVGLALILGGIALAQSRAIAAALRARAGH